MRINDNAPIDEPCIGRLIKENCSVGQFFDNCIYLIADEESSFAKKAVSLMEQYQARNEVNFNNYELEVVHNVELKNHPQIKERIERYGDNFVIQLSSFAESGKNFIVAKTDEENLFRDLCLMMYAAERIAKHDIGEAIKAFVKDNTDEFIELAGNAINDEGFQCKYLAGLADHSMQLSFGMATSTATLKERLEVKGVITHQQRMEMYSRFLDNLKIYHKTHDP